MVLNSSFFVNIIILILVLVLTLIVILFFLIGIWLPIITLFLFVLRSYLSFVHFLQSFESSFCVNVVIVYEIWVIQRNKWKILVNFLLSVEFVHILGANLVSIVSITDDPNTACRWEPYPFNNIGKDVRIYQYCSCSRVLTRLKICIFCIFFAMIITFLVDNVRILINKGIVLIRRSLIWFLIGQVEHHFIFSILALKIFEVFIIFFNFLNPTVFILAFIKSQPVCKEGFTFFRALEFYLFTFGFFFFLLDFFENGFLILLYFLDLFLVLNILIRCDSKIRL